MIHKFYPMGQEIGYHIWETTAAAEEGQHHEKMTVSGQTSKTEYDPGLSSTMYQMILTIQQQVNIIIHVESQNF